MLDFLFNHTPTPAERGVDWPFSPEEFIEFANKSEEEQWAFVSTHNITVY